jgi:hypothetical protein
LVRTDKAHYFEGAESLCKHVALKPEVTLEESKPRSPCWKCVGLLTKRRQGVAR